MALGRNQASQSSLEQALADRAMTKNNELRYGAPGDDCSSSLHRYAEDVCEATEWKMPWLKYHPRIRRAVHPCPRLPGPSLSQFF